MMGHIVKPAAKSAARRRARGALSLLGGLFVASALLRLGTDAGSVIAWAAEAEPPSDAAPAAEAPVSDALLEALATRETRIEQRERELLLRRQALRVAEEEITARLEELQAAESALKQTLDLARDAAENDIAQLTDVYARMKPRQASALFEQMDPQFAAGFLGRMPSEAAAAIMAGLSPEAAYRVSVMLAGRNVDVPRTEPDAPEPTPDPSEG